LLSRLLSRVFSPVDRPAEPANPLAKYFFDNPGRLIHKWHHYFEIYHRHFAAFRGRSPVVLEIGVFHGGSLQMWREYFGPGARIVGIDIDPRCRAFEEPPSITVLTGDQADRGFLASVRERLPRIDILIDDGGHTMAQQTATFEELYPHLQPEGIYLCEDLHTSFFPRFGGGYGRKDSFLEYSKALVDSLYGWYTQYCPQLVPGPTTQSTFALHFYDSVLVMEKRPMRPPVASTSGKPAF
jgi:SAM-dependent methyltransferase